MANQALMKRESVRPAPPPHFAASLFLFDHTQSFFFFLFLKGLEKTRFFFRTRYATTLPVGTYKFFFFSLLHDAERLSPPPRREAFFFSLSSEGPPLMAPTSAVRQAGLSF